MADPSDILAVKCKVLLFGPLAEAFGQRELELPLELGTTIRQLAARIQIEERLSQGMRVALNGEICDAEVEIPDASEVAFLPPVSGG